jgi:hypothetical protein
MIHLGIAMANHHVFPIEYVEYLSSLWMSFQEQSHYTTSCLFVDWIQDLRNLTLPTKSSGLPHLCLRDYCLLLIQYMWLNIRLCLSLFQWCTLGQWACIRYYLPVEISPKDFWIRQTNSHQQFQTKNKSPNVSFLFSYTTIEGLVEWSDVEFSICHIMQDYVNNLHFFSSIYIYRYRYKFPIGFGPLLVLILYKTDPWKKKHKSYGRMVLGICPNVQNFL